MRRRKAFTLIELLVVVAIIALLISILLPSLSRGRGLSKRTVCSANLRGIGQACKVYANDFNDAWPYAWAYNQLTIDPIAPFVSVSPPRATTETIDSSTVVSRPTRSSSKTARRKA